MTSDSSFDADAPWRRWAPAAIVLVAVLCYANALANGFVSDDALVVGNNPLVTGVSGLWRAFAHPYWPEASNAGQYRPLVIASFVIDRGVLHLGAWWVHLVNIGWHAAVCLLVYRVLAIVVTLEGALFGALWFALQPVHAEAVAMSVGRCELMAAAFVLVAWLAHRDRGRLAPLWFAAALASKESGIVFLGLAVLHDLLLEPDRRAAFTRRRPLYLAYALVGAVYAAALSLVFAHRKFVVTAATWDYASPTDRWLTMLRVVPEYLRLLLAPLDLRIDYSPRTIDLVTSVTPAVVFGAVLLIASGVVTALAWRRARAVALGLLWFIIALSPVSNVLFPSGVVLAERTLYLPTVGAAMVAAWLFERAVAVRPRAVLALAAILFGAFAIRTWTRTPFWHDKRHYVMAWVDEQPESYRAHYAVGMVLFLEQQWPEAQRECWIARRLYGGDTGPYITGAEIALARRDTTYAVALLDSALRRSPRDYAALYDLATIRRIQGRYRAAIALAFGAYEASPDSVGAIDILTGAAQQIGDFDDADQAFRRALVDHPANVHLRQSYAAMLLDRGDTAAARRQLAISGLGPVRALFEPPPVQ
jgi:protein O-mannosyl-transferase